MKKEYITEAESENSKVYRFFDEYCAKESFFYKLWQIRENIQTEIRKEDGLKIKNWVLKNKEELEKYDIEVLFEKGKLIFKYKIDKKENGENFNYYFGNYNDIYKKIGLSFSKKSIVIFHEWKNRNEVIKRRTKGISIDETLDQKIERMVDKTSIEARIGSDEYEMKTYFNKKMQIYFRNVKTNEWFYHEFGRIKKNTEAMQICEDCIKILEMLKSRTVSEFEKKRLSRLIKNIKENFSAGRFVRYSLPKNKISIKKIKNK